MNGLKIPLAIILAVAIHNVTPMFKDGATPDDAMVEMTEAEVRTAIQNWVADR